MKRKKASRKNGSITFAISPILKEKLQEIVDSGNYDSDSDFVRQAIQEKIEKEESQCKLSVTPGK